MINRGTECIIAKTFDDLAVQFRYDDVYNNICVLINLHLSRIPDKGNIYSIKFSSNYEILSLQTSQNSIDFIQFKNGQPTDLSFTHRLKV